MAPRNNAVNERMAGWRELSRVAGAVRAEVTRTLQERVGLSLTEGLLLCEVAHSPGRALRMAELAESLNLAKSAITKTVDRLEERGLLARERGDGDRRAISARLTDEGYDAFRATMPVLVGGVAAKLSALDDDEVRQLRRLLAKILAGSPPDVV